jgi:DNA-binding NarL/FixJ family response regulator
MKPQATARDRATPDYHLDRLAKLAPTLTISQRDRLAALARLTRPTTEQRQQQAAERREQRQRHAAERRRQAVQLRRQGMTHTAIAGTLGCSVATVEADLDIAVDSGALPAGLPRAKTPDQARQIEAAAQRRPQTAALRRQGLTYADIARRLGVSTTTVYHDLLITDAEAGDHDAA